MSWRSYRAWGRGLVGLVSLLLALVVGQALGALPAEAPRYDPALLAEGGAEHPVTGVLMNFRGYDTLLEMTVLVLAVLGARALASDEPAARQRPPSIQNNALLDAFLRAVLPAMLVVAGYLLWVGSHAPGGAFQAGALLGGAGVLMWLGGVDWTRALSERLERGIVTLGLAVFLLVALGAALAGPGLLTYPGHAAGTWILLIEAACALSIGAVLSALFFGGQIAAGAERSEP